MRSARHPDRSGRARRACSTWSSAEATSATRSSTIPDVDGISFTGSQTRRRAGRRRRGQAPGARAARDGRQESAGGARRRRPRPRRHCAIDGAFFATGQRCTASSRIIVTEGIHDRFVEALAEKARGAEGRRRARSRRRRSGRRSARSSSSRICATSDIARDEGGKVLTGGESRSSSARPAITWRRR